MTMQRPAALPRKRSALRSRFIAASATVPASAWGVTLAALVLSGCSTVERVRQGADLAATVSNQYAVETLVQADIERQRIRKARCFSPLLTPANLAAASADVRLGAPWVDELLRDCPVYASFLSELMVRRARSSGIIVMPAVEDAAVEHAEKTSVTLPGTP